MKLQSQSQANSKRHRKMKIEEIIEELETIKNAVEDITDAYIELNVNGEYSCDETISVDIDNLIEALQQNKE